MAELKISLASARVNAKMTQLEVSKALQKDVRTIINWENGASEPRITDAQRLCELYGLSMDNIDFSAH